jgi:hypothetical protein
MPLTEMSTRNLPGCKGRPARKADNFNAICEQLFSENVKTSTSHNLMGLHGVLQVNFTFVLYLDRISEWQIQDFRFSSFIVTLF